jgi:hypothetical protein
MRMDFLGMAAGGAGTRTLLPKHRHDYDPALVAASPAVRAAGQR